MNRTKVTKIYCDYYCTFCKNKTTIVSDGWEDTYLCSCIDAKEYERLIYKANMIKKDVLILEYTCNLEHLYRKMIQMELF